MTARNRIVGIIILVVIGAIVNECSSADRNSEGTITTQGELDAFETRIGDCFANLPSDAGNEETVEFKTLNAIPCNEPHRWQVVHKGYITNVEEYEVGEIENQASTICENAYKELFLSMSDSKYAEYKEAQSTNFVPTQKSWENGDRTVDCLVGSDNTEFYTSILNS
jgi:hypothetical protein